MREVYIVSGFRTAVGNFNGSLASVPAHKLGEIVIRKLLSSTGVSPDDIDEVIMGQVLTSAQGQNPARQAAVNAGINIKAPAMTINQVCGSGLRSVALGFQAIKNMDAEIIIAGGQENMSLSPHAIHMRNGVKMGDASMVDTMMRDGLTDAFAMYAMGVTAENIAKKFNITREMQDQFAYNSQMKAAAAVAAGRFVDEIVPVIIPNKKGDITFDKDEFIRGDTSLESLAKLRPAFDKEGTVTAGNASGINDGAAAVMIASAEAVKKYNLKPIARIASWASVGVDPSIMGTGPIDTVKKALAKANWKIEDLDLIEANEAFAAQAISVNMGLGWDESKVNVNGGAIAIGHPIGASGARVFVTLLHEMKRRNAKKAVATLCIGGGMGVAICLEGC